MTPGWEVRVDGPLMERLEDLAADRGTTPDQLVAEALERFVEDNK